MPQPIRESLQAERDLINGTAAQLLARYIQTGRPPCLPLATEDRDAIAAWRAAIALILTAIDDVYGRGAWRVTADVLIRGIRQRRLKGRRHDGFLTWRKVAAKLGVVSWRDLHDKAERRQYRPRPRPSSRKDRRTEKLTRAEAVERLVNIAGLMRLPAGKEIPRALLETAAETVMLGADDDDYAEPSEVTEQECEAAIEPFAREIVARVTARLFAEIVARDLVEINDTYRAAFAAVEKQPRTATG